jgi:hypothetical protein
MRRVDGSPAATQRCYSSVMSRQRVSLCVAVALLAFPCFAAAAPSVVVIGADVWSRPRSGAAFTRMPELRELVEVYERQPDGQLVVRHGSGEEGGLWAEEMRSWLVALGIPAARVRLETDPAVDGEVRIEVRAYGGNR